MRGARAGASVHTIFLLSVERGVHTFFQLNAERGVPHKFSGKSECACAHYFFGCAKSLDHLLILVVF